MTPEELRQRIEIGMGEKYAGLPDTLATRLLIAEDLALLHRIFPELDITAEVSDDRPPWVRRREIMSAHLNAFLKSIGERWK